MASRIRWLLVDRCRFRSRPTDFIQIMNISRSHWVCFEYDLTTRGSGGRWLQFWRCQLWPLPCRRSTSSGSCCLFAIACAASPYERKDPHIERYAQMEMRQHLARCFEEKKITYFPNFDGRRRLRRHRTINRRKVDVFCIILCHLPWDKYDGMRGLLVQCVLCKEWYHQKCSNIDRHC